jgi:hypothetical protein
MNGRRVITIRKIEDCPREKCPTATLLAEGGRNQMSTIFGPMLGTQC